MTTNNKGFKLPEKLIKNLGDYNDWQQLFDFLQKMNELNDDNK